MRKFSGERPTGIGSHRSRESPNPTPATGKEPPEFPPSWEQKLARRPTRTPAVPGGPCPPSSRLRLRRALRLLPRRGPRAAQVHELAQGIEPERRSQGDRAHRQQEAQELPQPETEHLEPVFLVALG